MDYSSSIGRMCFYFNVPENIHVILESAQNA